MLSKVFISCALFVAVQAAYAPAHSSYESPSAGYAAQLQPAVTLYVLPSHRHSYGVAPAHSASPAYGAVPAYGTAPAYSAASAAHGVDAEALRYASLALSLPSPGSPNAAVINVPQHSITYYSAPAVSVSSSGSYGGAASSQWAAAAASNVKPSSSGYAPAQAGSGYSPTAPSVY